MFNKSTDEKQELTDKLREAMWFLQTVQGPEAEKHAEVLEQVVSDLVTEINDETEAEEEEKTGDERFDGNIDIANQIDGLVDKLNVKEEERATLVWAEEKTAVGEKVLLRVEIDLFKLSSEEREKREEADRIMEESMSKLESAVHDLEESLRPEPEEKSGFRRFLGR